jgi:hypothetical protein
MGYISYELPLSLLSQPSILLSKKRSFFVRDLSFFSPPPVPKSKILEREEEKKKTKRSLSKEIGDFFGTDSGASSCSQPYYMVGDRKGNREGLPPVKKIIDFYETLVFLTKGKEWLRIRRYQFI